MRPFLVALALATTSLVSAPSALADGPRIVVVVEGDAAESTLGAAQRLEDAVAASNSVTLPGDALIRAALRGAEASPDDGLDAVRGLRRRIGWSVDADREALGAIGEQLELVAIILVRGGSMPVARVYDVAAVQFFVGEAALDDASLETSTRFVLARVRAAERRRVAPPPDSAATAGESNVGTTAVAPEIAGALTPSTAPDQPVQRSWIRRNWPFLVAGALLAGTTTFFIAQRAGRDTTSPVIHIRPGGT